jgi:hypothetical protein
MKWMRRSIVALLVAGSLSLGLAGPAAAQPVDQDGLVNVFVGDDVVAACVPITAAVNDVIRLCGLDVNVFLAVLGQIRAVDRSGRAREFCTTDEGDTVTVSDTTCPN